MATMLRVVNQQRLVRSILLDKIDRSQGNFTGYANRAKFALYVPYANPLDPSVKGYVDLPPTDEVLLQAGKAKGVIAQLVAKGYVTTTAFNTTVTATPVVTSAADALGTLTINGTTFLSLAPDVTYVILTNPGTGATQTVPQSSFATQSGTQITIANATVTIGTPGAGWKVQVQANSKKSNIFTL